MNALSMVSLRSLFIFKEIISVGRNHTIVGWKLLLYDFCTKGTWGRKQVGVLYNHQCHRSDKRRRTKIWWASAPIATLGNR